MFEIALQDPSGVHPSGRSASAAELATELLRGVVCADESGRLVTPATPWVVQRLEVAAVLAQLVQAAALDRIAEAVAGVAAQLEQLGEHGSAVSESIDGLAVAVESLTAAIDDQKSEVAAR